MTSVPTTELAQHHRLNTFGRTRVILHGRQRPDERIGAGNVQPSASVKIADVVHLGMLNAPLLSHRSLPSVSITLSPRTSPISGHLSRNALGLGLPSVRQSPEESIIFAHGLALTESLRRPVYALEPVVGIHNTLANSLWKRAPTLSLQLSSASRYSSVDSAPDLSAPSLVLAQKYFKEKPVIRTARRETFCLAGATKDAPVGHLLDNSGSSDSGNRTVEERTSCEPPCVTAEDLKLPLRSDAFLDFMVNSGLIGRRKRSKRGRGIAASGK
ncbi:hypothetical protein QFC24_004522 [Naganishia onofrii]|uniref:Uncharacterized protein n=1 Tax=Naganishia onofrii TaxID=1851511 RepID=A0ACC2XEB2_9TREE|nr:hypothetical protein QFC24_004522 [Naganishia onofrii]